MKKSILFWLGLLPLAWMFVPGEAGLFDNNNPENQSSFEYAIEINTDCSVCDSVSMIDSLALVALYDNAGGEGWYPKNWDLQEPVCTWGGVTLDGDCLVNELKLNSNNLDGILPLEIGNLINLTLLNLDSNHLEESIPPILGDFENLTELNLGRNDFTGVIPEELGNLLDLKILALNNNNLCGSIPGSLVNLTNLCRLSLGDNNLSGSIPAFLGDMTGLISLILESNDFTGPIPPELGDLINLKSLHLSGNELEGAIPPDFGQLVSLTSLYLMVSSLSGELPDTLKCLVNLIDLRISYNQFSGEPPSWLAELPQLDFVHINNNNFSGCYPDNYVNFCDNTFNASDNPGLFWGGDWQMFQMWCNEEVDQIGAPCDDGNLQTENDTISVDCSCVGTGSCIENDSLALVAFYNSTGGSTTWNNNTNWLVPGQPINTWYGVNVNMDGCVVCLDLDGDENCSWFTCGFNLTSGNGLTGELPLQIGNLSELKHLSLSKNNLSGDIPSTIWGLEKLEHLNLSNNIFTGNIPQNLSNLSQLQRLDLSYNELTDSIPSEIDQLIVLTCLNLEGNSLHGAIPLSIGNLTNLEYLFLGLNDSLSGNIPYEISLLTSLKELELQINNLEGAIPNIWEGLSNLRVLRLGSNQLTDTIPESIWELSNLEELSLEGNDLEGAISPLVDELEKLEVLQLNDNNFIGNIPEQIGNLTNLITFRLHSNDLEGTIPDSLKKLENILHLNLRNNNLSGNIPDCLGELNTLFILDLRNNELEGMIPSQLGDLGNLTTLQLDDNNLSGCIPEELLDTHCGIAVFVLLNNPKLPWNGDVDSLCLNENQTGAPCDDGYPQTENDTIRADCICIGECIIQFETNIDTTLCYNESITIGSTEYDTQGMFSETLSTEIGCDSIVNLNLDFYLEATENIDDTLCIGESLEIDGIVYDEETPEGMQVLSGQAATGCDSTINIQLSFINGETTGYAIAEPDTVLCEEYELFLNTSLPSSTTGEWTSLNNAANIENPNQSSTFVSDLSEGENTFIWTLSTAQCANYDTDTLVISVYSGFPFAEADQFVTNINTSTTDNLLDNDELEDVADMVFITNVENIEAETSLEGNLIVEQDGTFIFIPELDSSGVYVFEYEICDANCLDFCSSARARIEVILESNTSIAAPNVITPNGDKYNEYFIIPKLYESPADFPNNKLMIFNQWGVLVYETQFYQNDWNGVNQNGQALPQATYYYYFEDGNGETISGRVAILK